MQTFFDFLDTTAGASLVGLAFAAGVFVSGAVALFPEFFMSLIP